MPRLRSVADTIADEMATDPTYVDGDLVIAIPDPRGGLNVLRTDGSCCEHLMARDLMPYGDDDPHQAVNDLFEDLNHDVSRSSDTASEWEQSVTFDPQILGMEVTCVHEIVPDLRGQVMHVAFDAMPEGETEPSYVSVEIPLAECHNDQALTDAVLRALRDVNEPDLEDDELPL